MQEQQPTEQDALSPTAAKGQPEATYQERCRRFAAARDLYHRRSVWNANLNVALVLAALACLGRGFWFGGLPFFLAGGLLFLGFVAAYIHLGRLDRLEQRYQTLWQINQEGLLRRSRDWAHLPSRQSADSAAAHPYAADLDLTGHASLSHLLSTANTPIGQATLRGWLLQPAAPAEIATRQHAVAELAPAIDFRDHLALSGWLLGKSQSSYERFLRWAEGDAWLAARPWLIWAARLLAVLALLFAGLQAIGLVSYSLWIFPLAINLVILGVYGRKVHEVLEEVEARQEALRAYADLFGQITGQRISAARLQELQARLSVGGISADRQMRRLARLMPLVTIRRSMLFFLIEWLTLWSFHTLWLLERWQRVAGRSARAWLEALGEMEALAALAALAHDHPAWTFPELIEDRSLVLQADQLGHPLLPPAACVPSDVQLGPPGMFLLVTGSNMSGKSTLLRALGVNIVLAQAGGPVCSSRLCLAPLALATSIRVQDSLEQGVSYFMAELKRIKAAVDLVAQAQATGERQPVFLLDEILHGTNTAERQIAVRQIVRHLLALGGTGAISTHDLSLADVPELAAASQPVHFSETFLEGSKGLEMLFDYHLRPGIATSTNALKLLKLVGL